MPERTSWRQALKSFVPQPIRRAVASSRLTRLSQQEVYREFGPQYLGFFRELAGLRPTDQVLDVGCGFARIAQGLTGYLRDGGSFDGFDVLEGEIEWCRRNVTRKHAHFRFQVADLYNKFYNPAGTQQAADFRFPYDDAAFDFVYLISVFSHMLPGDMDHYLSEIARVLRPGGRCFITYYLLNADAYARGAAEHFPFQADGYRAHNQNTAEWAVAYEEDAIRALYKKHGLIVQEPIQYGTWCGRETRFSSQDIIVAVKP